MKSNAVADKAGLKVLTLESSCSERKLNEKKHILKDSFYDLFYKVCDEME